MFFYRKKELQGTNNQPKIRVCINAHYDYSISGQKKGFHLRKCWKFLGTNGLNIFKNSISKLVLEFPNETGPTGHVLTCANRI